MKKNTLRTIADYIRNIPELANESAELDAEIAKDESKVQANRELYATAHDVAMEVLTDKPMTIAEWFAACGDKMPNGFTKSKMQYAVREYWASEVVKIEGKVNEYRKA